MPGVALLLVTDPRKQPRRLDIVELPEVPTIGDAIEHSGRGYEIIGRSWNTAAANVVGGQVAQVAIMLRQVAGPPHIMETLHG